MALLNSWIIKYFQLNSQCLCSVVKLLFSEVLWSSSSLDSGHSSSL